MKESFKIILKFILYPFVQTIYFLSGYIHRNNRIWLFGVQKNAFNDNTKHLYAYVNDNYSDKIIAIWITGNRKLVSQIRAKGYRAYFRWSLRGAYYSMIGKYWFITSSVAEIMYMTSNNAIVVNLFHGIPLKKIYFDSDNNEEWIRYHQPTWFQENIIEPFTYRLSAYIVTPSQKISHDSFSRAMKVKIENCLPFGLSRTDIFFLNERDKFQWISKWNSVESINFIEKLKEYNYVWIYMPTWRENSPRFLNDLEIDFDKINDLLKFKNETLILKLHPYTPEDILSKYLNYSNILIYPSSEDIYPILSYTDCLITDYSSIYIDYMLLEKATVFFAFDLEIFQRQARGFYYKYHDFVNGPIIRTNREFEDLFIYKKSLEDYSSNQNHLKLKQYFFDNYDGLSSKRLVDYLIEKG